MAKNSEVYKTAQERAEAFGNYCEGRSHMTDNKCLLETDCNSCRFAWLDLEAEEEKPLPCIWCKSEMMHIKEGSGHFLACVNCNHSTRKFETNEELVREYNRIAKLSQKAM